ncbi:response regulator transcription factor [Raoultibacter massiliensis]|uniref:helix-turn-helix transcriptional regulator n=1 Tax=Raoultibacter massiliensis TaxID=1852371 RepID=UPI003A901BB3
MKVDAVKQPETDGTPFSFRLLGIGFWQAWWMLVLCTTIVVPPDLSFLGVRPSVWTLLFTSVGFALAAAAAPRVGSFIERASMFKLAALLCTVGTGACVAMRGFSGHDALAVLLLVFLMVAAFGNALLLVMWGELWATLATDRVSQYLFSSYAFAFVLFFGVQLLPWMVTAVLVCLLPLASCAILYASRDETRRAPSAADFAVDRPLVVKAMGAVVVAGLAYGIAQSFYANMASLHVAEGRPDLLVAGACFIALAAHIAFERSAAAPIAMYRPIVPALSVGLILFAILPLAYGYFGNGLIIVGGYCLDILIMLVSADLAFRARRSVALFFSCSILVLRLATIAGLAAVDIAVGRGVVSAESQLHLLAALAILVILVGTLVFSQGELQRFYQPQPAIRENRDLDDHCRALSERCGLTAREAEVLVLLASGRNVPFICKELCIAESTARHHVGSIYRKLGVYDRQGMIDVILQS